MGRGGKGGRAGRRELGRSMVVFGLKHELRDALETIVMNTVELEQ